jgi:uncharacterized protein YecT (DUF1311 family)
MTACVVATANTAPAKLLETKGSAGFMVSGRAGALAVSGGGEIQAEFIKVQKVTDSSTSVIDAFDLELSEKCRKNLIKRRSSGIDISAWWVITETFNATVIERSCEGKEAVARARIMLARGEISGESSCSEETIETGVIAFKGVPVTELLEDATVPVAVPAAASVPMAVAVPSQATASVDFGGGGGGLGVAERLRQQRCDETAKVKGEKARAARLVTAEQGAQTKARTAWSGQSAELEMCASLKRAERDGCIGAVNAWLGVARAMVVSIPAGVEPIETECGTRQPVYEAVERTVVASDVNAAESLLAQLQALDSRTEPPTTTRNYGLLTHVPEASPSYSCAKATMLDEHIICSHVDLARRDKAMAELYFSLRRKTRGDMKRVFTQTQRDWVKLRGSCETYSCINSMLVARIRSLTHEKSRVPGTAY